MADREKEEMSRFVPDSVDVDLSRNSCSKIGFFMRLKSDSNYRHKILDTLCLWIAVFVFGFVYGQAGPTLPDLQQITEVDLDTASWLFTIFSLGYLLGCFLAGVLERATSPRLSLFVCLCGMAVFTILTPWCSIFGLMLAARACVGIFFGGIDVGGHSFIFRIWRKDVHTYLQVLYFTLASGCLAAPFATTPFLSKKVDQLKLDKIKINQSEYFTGGTFHFSNDSEVAYLLQNYSNSNRHNLHKNSSSHSSETNVHYSFLISGIITFCAAVPFIIMHVWKPTHVYVSKKADVSATKEKNYRTRPTKATYYLAVIILTALLSIRTGWTSTFTGFLTSFCSRHLSWTKPQGNIATSIFFIAYAIGNFICIFLVQCLKPGLLLMSFLMCLNASLIAFTVASIFLSDLGIWICVALVGVSISATWPTVLTWTEDHVTPITGKIASLLLFSGAVGQMVNPVAVGYIMENVSNLGFAYWHLGEMIFITLLFLFVAGLYWNVDLRETEPKAHNDMEFEINL